VNESRSRPATAADIEAIAKVHALAFPGFFLSKMGFGFLCAYYRLVLDYPGGILLVNGQAPEVDGFVTGFAAPARFYAFMADEKRRFYWPTLAAILRRPALLPRVLHNRRRVEAANVHTSPVLCELSSIGVSPQSAGQGLGRSLVDDFCTEARRMGCERIVLTTDSAQNDTVNAFYLRCGFTLQRSFAAGGSRLMNEYTRSLAAGGNLSGDQPE
jgi:ribosomal protein S18 acetylase RimI-like enzyme